jgi:hypothetical protein
MLGRLIGEEVVLKTVLDPTWASSARIRAS